MQLTEGSIEQEIKNLGADKAPRISAEGIDAMILTAQYWQPPVTCLTVCALTLQNGFNVVGEAACASPENFNPEIGRKIAFEHARNQIWKLEGYRLRCELAAQQEDF